MSQHILLTEIALTSATLGAVAGAGLFALARAGGHMRLLLYVVSLCVYFELEFVQTARWQPSKVTSKLFLIWGGRGAREFWLVQAANLWEYALRRSRFAPPPANAWWTLAAGASAAVCGQWLRAVAMQTCGESFSHYVATAATQTPLVCHGVYAYSRHPSYLGFWLWVVGLEVMAENWGCLVLSVAVMCCFFKQRIEFEEWFLVNRLYGQRYTEYRRAVGVWIPLVWVREPPQAT